jgi:MFS transporter, ACS family, hexuronate transporter
MTNSSIGKYRWTVCGLIFFATTINYLDRAVISLLKPALTEEFNWNDGDYANIEIAFKVSYAIGLLGAGRLIDKLGTKIGYFLFTLLWSIASVCHAFAKSVLGFGIARSLLGITESGNFPAAVKTVAEWFPPQERALATGIFNSGANIGAIAAPLTVPWINEHLGWQWAFVITGATGFVWLLFWLILYEVPQKSRKLSLNELKYISEDSIAPDVPAKNSFSAKKKWLQLLKLKAVWGFAIGKFLTDPVWWFYLFWLPDFLNSQYQLKGTAIAWPVAVVYCISVAGSIAGGLLPMYLIKKGWPVFKARKTTMFLYALFALPVVTAVLLGRLNMWYAVLLIGVAAAAHQAWSANIFTTVSDFFSKSEVASVTGIGGMFGALGGILLSMFVQKNLFLHYRSVGNIETAYYIMFLLCGLMYITAWLVMYSLFPKNENQSTIQ